MRRLVLQARDVGGDFLQLENQVWWDDGFGRKAAEALEDENARLKKLLAEQMLDAAAMKELLSKKW